MTDIELQYQALKQLQRNPRLTQRELAEILGVSLGKTNYLVKSLLDVGWLKLENFRKSDNKMGYIYLLTPMGIAEKAAITRRFLDRKRSEFERLVLEIEALEGEVSAPEAQER
jgi:MarR family transcriptional regulator, temperature-dependent positive regulator of motility